MIINNSYNDDVADDATASSSNELNRNFISVFTTKSESHKTKTD